MLKKRQMMREAGDESRTAADRFYSLAARSAGRLGQRTSNHLHTKICDRAYPGPRREDGGHLHHRGARWYASGGDHPVLWPWHRQSGSVGHPPDAHPFI